MSESNNCRECSLPVVKYKQVKQKEKNVCESCYLTKGVPSDYTPKDVLERDKINKS